MNASRLRLSPRQEFWLASRAQGSAFLSSLATQYGERGWLSPAQVAALNRAMAR